MIAEQEEGRYSSKRKGDTVLIEGRYSFERREIQF
jgi:hypothetical protein